MNGGVGLVGGGARVGGFGQGGDLGTPEALEAIDMKMFSCVEWRKGHPRMRSCL